MALTKQIAIAKSAPLVAVGLAAVLCSSVPALAQTPAPATAFGQEMPQQYFLNRLTNPVPDAAEGRSSSAGCPQQQAANLGSPQQPAAATAFGQEMPQQYFLNRFTNPAPAAPEGCPSSASGPQQAVQATPGNRQQAPNAGSPQHAANPRGPHKAANVGSPEQAATAGSPQQAANPGGPQQAASSGSPQQAANADDDDGRGPYPKRYLLNRLFDLGGH